MREPTNQEVLDILAEECAEVCHAISKIRRFGVDDIHPESGETNRALLKREVMDLLTMLDWTEERGVVDLPLEEMLEHKDTKRDKVKEHLR